MRALHHRCVAIFEGLSIFLLLILGFCAIASSHGCAAIVGGAAGAGTGYVAGHEAAEHEEKKNDANK